MQTKNSCSALFFKRWWQWPLTASVHGMEQHHSNQEQSCWVLRSADASAFLLSVAPREPCNSPIFLSSTIWAHRELMFALVSVFVQWSRVCQVIGNGISSSCVAFHCLFVGWRIIWTGNSVPLADCHSKLLVYQAFFNCKGNLMTLCFWIPGFHGAQVFYFYAK